MTIKAVYARNPGRFFNGEPKVAMPPEEVFINPVIDTEASCEPKTGVNFPTLKRANAI